MSRFLAVEAEFLFNAFLAFFSSKFANFNDIDIHGIRISSFHGGGEGLVGLMSGFGVAL